MYTNSFFTHLMNEHKNNYNNEGEHYSLKPLIKKQEKTVTKTKSGKKVQGCLIWFGILNGAVYSTSSVLLLSLL